MSRNHLHPETRIQELEDEVESLKARVLALESLIEGGETHTSELVGGGPGD